jgi:hypothetical protein
MGPDTGLACPLLALSTGLLASLGSENFSRGGGEGRLLRLQEGALGSLEAPVRVSSVAK